MKEKKELIIRVCPFCKGTDIYKSDLRKGFKFRCNDCGEYLK